MTTTEPATAVQHMIRRRKPRSDPNSKAANDAGPGKEAHADVCDQNRFGFVQYSFILLLSLLCALAWWAKNHSTNSWLPSDPRQPMTIASRVTGSSIQNESQASPQSGASSTEDTALPVQHLESDATTEEVNDEFRMQVPKLLPTAQFDRREEVYSGADVPYEAFIDVFVRNANLSQPLLQFQDNAMPDNEFQDLQECLREHPMRHSNVNDGDTFKGTRGFLLSYNKAGIDKFASNPSFSCLEPYFRRHVRPDADAWVLNMVWADIPDYRKELAIQRHTDDAIMMDYAGSRKVMPLQTNVLYVFVPEDMKGGELEAWDYDATERQVAAGPQGRVRPEENRMAFFRGDAQHQVKSYTTSSKDVLRGSLVLEQYKIPEEYKQYVMEFHWRENDGSAMM